VRTETVLEMPPSTLRLKLPLEIPFPLRGMMPGELGSELVMVRLPVSGPSPVGLNVMVAVQLAPGARVDVLHGVETL
jgi:hypothetical protein